MGIQRLFILVFLTPAIVAAQGAESTVDAIHSVLDDFHDAAAHGDNSRYLGHLTADAVFMGTDEWERWPKDPEFVEYVNGRFEDGRGWAYESVDRNVQLSPLANVAWFDEVIFSETSGRFRGTGVLVLQSGQWRIAHYAMSFLIFNENWEDVIKLSKETAAQKRSAE